MPKEDTRKSQVNRGFFNDFKGGVLEDSKDRLELPFWKLLDNLWIRDETEAHGRPHAHNYLGLTNTVGIAISHENTPIVLADGSVYINGALNGSYTGSGPVSYDASRGKTVVTAGGTPFVYDGSGITQLAHTNVKCVALAFGPSKSRLFFVKNNDLRTLWFTTRNWNDIGTIVLDGSGNTDLKTEGGRFKGWDSDILDIMEFLGDLVVFCRRGIFRLDFTIKEGLMYPVKRKVGDIEVWNVKPIRFPAGIHFLNGQGPGIYSISETGPFVDLVKAPGKDDLGRNARIIQNELIEAEARLGYDSVRRFLFIKTKNGSRPWILHTNEKNIFTRWDLDFSDIKSVNGRTYMTDGSGAYELKDEGDGQNSYLITVASGLLGFGDPGLVKRMDSIGVLAYFTSRGSYHIGFLPDYLRDVNWVPTKFPTNYTGPNKIGGLCRIDESTKHQFEIGAFRLTFRNYDRFILHDLYAKWIEKDARREDST